MSNEFFRFHKYGNYTNIDNRTIRDSELSLRGLALLVKMKSLPPDWNYSFNGLVAICKEGKAAVASALDDLKKAGYVTVTQLRDDKGHFSSSVFDIYEVPERLLNKEFNPQPENRLTDNPLAEKQPQLNSSNNKIEKVEKEKNYNLKYLENYFVKEIVKTGYVTKEEYNLAYYNNLFNEAEYMGYEYEEIMQSIHWVTTKIKQNEYKDEFGNEIKNKYGYFKNAFIDNLEKMRNRKELLKKDLYSEESLEEDLKSFDGYFKNKSDDREER